MADNDILFDETKRQQVKAIFIKQGYQVKSYGRGNHDVYEKPPIYNFEMHVALFHEEFSQLQQKYKSIDKKLVKDENHPYLLKFTLEDFYVFVVSHAYKHYICGGTGIRTLADIYVINFKFGKRFDWNYIKSELQELGISEYEQKNRKLAFKIFDKAKKISEQNLSEDEAQMLTYYIGSNTYGNMYNLTLYQLKELQPDGKPIIQF